MTLVALATEHDLSANAEYIRLADMYFELPAGGNANNFANVDLIVDVAQRAGVHAVWPGWGHASEDPRLPEQLAALSPPIAFMGPPAAAMHALGDKISSMIVAQHAGLPCLPWSGSEVCETEIGADGCVSVPRAAYARACLRDAEHGLACAHAIGFPVMLKASEGGGGKGIRMCHSPESFTQLYGAVLGEVPGSPVFLMKLAEDARHLEVQLLADQHGQVVSLYGRDCSVQRRHQKIMEEAPICIAPPHVCRAMEQASVRLAELVGYQSVGTVEWLYTPETEAYTFLELNPRLQVEHPTTEMVTGINIPAAQLQVAMGIPLQQIDSVCALYGVPRGAGVWRALHKEARAPQGHVVACRITAENPDEGFQPNLGALHELQLRSGPGTWGYFSIGAHGALHKYADSQFGHVFVHAKDRDEARRQMVVALKALSVHGEFRTTVEYLVTLLESPAFARNAVTTGWLDALLRDKAPQKRVALHVAVLCGAAVRAQLLARTSRDEFRLALRRGQAPPCGTLRVVYAMEFVYDGKLFAVEARQCAPREWALCINSQTAHVDVRELSDGGMLVRLSGRAHTVYWSEDAAQLRLSINGQTCVFEEEQDPSRICCSTPGKLVRFLVCEHEHVAAGTSIAEIEVMKMYLPVVAEVGGAVSFARAPGETLAAGDLVAVLAVDDASLFRRPAPFAGAWPTGAPAELPSREPHQRLAHARAALEHVLAGYLVKDIDTAVDTFVAMLREPSLPFAQLREALARAHSRVPLAVQRALHAALDEACGVFPVQALRRTLDRVADADAAAALAPAVAVVEEHRFGLAYYECAALCALFAQYAAVEAVFAGGPDAVLRRREAGDSEDAILALQLSHEGCASKNALILQLLEPHVQDADLVSNAAGAQDMVRALQSLSVLRGAAVAPVALKAREILLCAQLPSFATRREQMERTLRTSILARTGRASTPHTPGLEPLLTLSATTHRTVDVLQTFFAHPSPGVAYAALATYVLRAYRVYDILSFRPATLRVGGHACALLTWAFRMPPGLLSDRTKERQASVTDLAAHKAHRSVPPPLRQGAMTCCARCVQLEELVSRALPCLDAPVDEPVHVLTVAVVGERRPQSELRPEIAQVIARQAPALARAGVCRVTVLVGRERLYPLYITWRRSGEHWGEEQGIQNVEPALAHELELDRMLAHFDVAPVQLNSSTVYLYHARGTRNRADVRFFVRVLVRPMPPPRDVREYVLVESERVLVESLDCLEVALGQHAYCAADGSHLFLSWLFPIDLALKDILGVVRTLAERYTERFTRLRVEEAEMRIMLSGGGQPRRVHVFVSAMSAFQLRYEVYDEEALPSGDTVLRTITAPSCCPARGGTSIHTPYTNRSALATRRACAERLGTTFVYDLVDALRHALCAQRRQASDTDPVVSATELVLGADGLAPTSRAPAQNTVGMVVWHLVLATEEYPAGRPLYLAANDISVQAGSVGPAEAALFSAAAARARAEKVPFLYVSANSGARLGLVPDVLDKFRAKLRDDAAGGIEYLYLDDAALAALRPGCVRTRAVRAPDGTTHHVLTDIIGAADAGLGVESLSGSGRAAGEMSRAREAIFTATIVTGRSVGIGAYLARLSGRVIQVESAPMVLTGFQALNQLLGRQVYVSNMQLGGPQVMAHNGVSHLVARSDLDAMHAYVRWLSYVPAHAGAPLPRSPSLDPVERTVAYVPPAAAYDPRLLIVGDAHAPGLFDRGSFQETLPEWATSVVVGRARLGGIPFGVIAAETRTLERVVPADPANPHSTEQRVLEAGLVWYPNSALKTAQAITDFHREGLPLLVLANWRGFSGGQQDMRDEMLTQGSKIVDALAAYTRPVFVHLPPRAELRGGSWVVLDSAVSASGHMEMSADPSARGSVLEAAGLVEIKFRTDRQRAVMERLDAGYAELAARQRTATDRDARATAAARAAERERELAPLYHTIALEYADAHDRAGRMLATGVLRRTVAWEGARAYFYWRARRRLAELRAQQALLRADTALDADAAQALVYDAAGYKESDSDQAAVHRLDTADAAIQTAIATAQARAVRAALDALSPEARRMALADK